MKIFLDTNVLIAAVIKQHVFHERAFSVFNTVLELKNEGYVASHSQIEMYSVLTKLPSPYRHAPEQALLSIEENVLKHFKAVQLRAPDYPALLREAVGAGIQGGTIYDALVLKCAELAGVDRVYTLNLKHFRAFGAPEIVNKIVEP